MPRWWLAIGLTACGSAQPMPAASAASELEPAVSAASDFVPWATDCMTKKTFVEAGDSALEGVIVNCMTGDKIPDVQVFAKGIAGTAGDGDTISDASGRYRLQLPEGRYQLLLVQDYVDVHSGEVEIRPQHATVEAIRLDVPRCPPARGRPAVAPLADRAALVAAVLDHHAAAGIVDAPRRSVPGPVYVTIQGLQVLALPSNYARRYIVTTKDDLQREATRSGRETWFINISDSRDRRGLCDGVRRRRLRRPSHSGHHQAVLLPRRRSLPQAWWPLGVPDEPRRCLHLTKERALATELGGTILRPGLAYLAGRQGPAVHATRRCWPRASRFRAGPYMFHMSSKEVALSASAAIDCARVCAPRRGSISTRQSNHGRDGPDEG